MKNHNWTEMKWTRLNDRPHWVESADILVGVQLESLLPLKQYVQIVVVVMMESFDFFPPMHM